jgi:hypothetical protein
MFARIDKWTRSTAAGIVQSRGFPAQKPKGGVVKCSKKDLPLPTYCSAVARRQDLKGGHPGYISVPGAGHETLAFWGLPGAILRDLLKHMTAIQEFVPPRQ